MKFFLQMFSFFHSFVAILTYGFEISVIFLSHPVGLAGNMANLNGPANCDPTPIPGQTDLWRPA